MRRGSVTLSQFRDGVLTEARAVLCYRHIFIYVTVMEIERVMSRQTDTLPMNPRPHFIKNEEHFKNSLRSTVIDDVQR